MRRLSVLVLLAGCLGSEEAPSVMLPVGTSDAPLPAATTDLGYTVQISSLRIAVSTIQFTIEGEEHADATAHVTAKNGTSNVIALPHPGHSAGGDVTGEMPGSFILTWNGQSLPALGTAKIIIGDYKGANFTFRAADASDGLPDGDPLLGHAFDIIGTISKDGTTKPFHAQLDVEVDSQVIGALFDDVITETSTATLAFLFHPTDPYELDTAFDAIDFFQLPETDGTIAILPGSAAHNFLRRTIQTHDHYSVVAQ